MCFTVSNLTCLRFWKTILRGVLAKPSTGSAYVTFAKLPLQSATLHFFTLYTSIPVGAVAGARIALQTRLMPSSQAPAADSQQVDGTDQNSSKPATRGPGIAPNPKVASGGGYVNKTKVRRLDRLRSRNDLHFLFQAST